MIRRGEWRGPTSGVAPGYAQANLVVVHREWSEEFRRFCLRNPRACPLLDVSAAGSPRSERLARDADLRTDLGGYRVYERGTCERRDDLLQDWNEDMVAFLIGCSFGFERALDRAGIPMRHLELRRTVPMFISNMECEPVGRLSGPLVVSMRPIVAAQVDLVRRICARYPGAHGEPLHVGDPAAVGIMDLARPDFGEPVPIGENEVPVFWGCGVTPQVVLGRSHCEWFASHEPGRMLVTDQHELIEPLSA